MESCLLCRENITESDNSIPVQSTQWLQLQILDIIEKHFWPIVNIESLYGICQRCWLQLYEFHQFYTDITQAHLNNTQIDNKYLISNKLETKTIATPRIIKDETLSNDLINSTNDEIITDSIVEDNPNKDTSLVWVPATNITTGDMEVTINIAMQKKKRGRPCKKIALNKPKGKVGRPRKILKQINNLASTNDVSSIRNGSTATKSYPIATLAGRNKKPKGKVGRPRKYFKKLKDIPSTNQSLINNGSSAEKNVAMLEPLPRKRGRPFKKKRGRQYKNQTNEILEIPLEEPDTDSYTVKEKLLNHLSLNDDDLQKTKELDIKNIFKKRQRIKQHKAQMRNYIATSVRCMKFVKN